jgi:hypothetical protein
MKKLFLRKNLLSSILIVLLLNYNPFYAQNKLDKSKSELTQKSTTPSDINKSSSKTNLSNEEVSLFIEILGCVFVYSIVKGYRNEDLKIATPTYNFIALSYGIYL